MTEWTLAECHVLYDRCEGINGGILTRSAEGWDVTTIEQLGGYSALLPLHLGTPGTSMRVNVEIDMQAGCIGLALVDDYLTLLHERRTTHYGLARLGLEAFDATRVRGLLVRNMSVFPGPSRARLRAITFEAAPILWQIEPPAATTAGPVCLPLRRYTESTHGAETNGTWHTDVRHFAVRDVVLVVMDAWATHDSAGWMQRAEANMRQNLAPLLQAVRTAGIRVIHASHDRTPHPLVAPAEGDIVLDGAVSTQSFVDLLEHLGTRLIVYTGYSSNMCVMTRPIGLLHMQNRGFELALVRDASLAMETPDTLAGEWMHAAMVNFVELNLAATVTAREMSAAAYAAAGMPAKAAE